MVSVGGVSIVVAGVDDIVWYGARSALLIVPIFGAHKFKIQTITFQLEPLVISAILSKTI